MSKTIEINCCNPSYYYDLTLFPVISTKEELEQSEWKEYIDIVYGIETIQNNYPIYISKFIFFYTSILPKRVLKILKDTNSVNEYPVLEGTFFSNMNEIFNVPNGLWSYIYPISTLPSSFPLDFSSTEKHPKPPFPYSNGFESNQWIEVTHCGRDDAGTWFYFARGSGNWYNLGKTIIFDDHIDAVCYFTGMNKYEIIQSSDTAFCAAGVYDKLLYKYAYGKYDSLQFRYRYENNLVIPENGKFKYEIMDCRVKPETKQTPCVNTLAELKPYIKTGWWTYEFPKEGQPPLDCVCNEKRLCDECQICLNCRKIQYSNKKIPENQVTTKKCPTSLLWTPWLFPVIRNENELIISCWKDYLINIYGDKIESMYPIDLSLFNFFYNDKNPTINQIKNTIKKYPKKLGDFYKNDCNSFWAYIYPFANPLNTKGCFSCQNVKPIKTVNTKLPYFIYENGIAANTEIEVIEKDDFLYFAKGSGNFINIGETMVFSNENQALIYFQSKNINELKNKMKEKNLNTIQITYFIEQNKITSFYVFKIITC